jgi:hypothetical protein
VSVADSATEEFYGLQAGELQWFGFTSVARLQAEFEITGLLTPDGGRLNRRGRRWARRWGMSFKDQWGPPRTRVLKGPEHPTYGEAP